VKPDFPVTSVSSVKVRQAYLEVWVQVYCPDPQCRRRWPDVKTVGAVWLRSRCAGCKQLYEIEVSPMKV
jgi:hypothetical protein